MRVRTPLDFGLVIRERRRAASMDQRTLAAKVGVSRQWVIAAEKGNPGAELGLVLRALGVLGVPLSVDDAPPRGRPKAEAPMVDLVDRARGKRR